LKLGASYIVNFWEICDISEFLEYVHSINLSIVELVLEPPKCDIYSISKDQRADIQKLVQKLSLELTVHNVFSDINIAAYNKQIRDFSVKLHKDCFDFAADIGATIATVHPGHLRALGASYPDEVINNNKSSLQLLAEYAGSKNLLIGYENMPNLSWSQFDEAIDPIAINKLINQLNIPNLGITWDIGHSFTTPLSQEIYFENFRDKLIHTHIHDNMGPGDGWLDTHLAVGKGKINWIQIIDMLKSINYNGALILEINTKEGINTSLNYLYEIL